MEQQSEECGITVDQTAILTEELSRGKKYLDGRLTLFDACKMAMEEVKRAGADVETICVTYLMGVINLMTEKDRKKIPGSMHYIFRYDDFSRVSSAVGGRIGHYLLAPFCHPKVKFAIMAWRFPYYYNCLFFKHDPRFKEAILAEGYYVIAMARSVMPHGKLIFERTLVPMLEENQIDHNISDEDLAEQLAIYFDLQIKL